MIQYLRIIGYIGICVSVLLMACDDVATDENPAPVYKIGYENANALYTVNADGTGLSILVDGLHPSWSPDGSKIAFYREIEGFEGDFITYTFEMYTVNSDGTGLFYLADGLNPSWSHNGTKIVYDSEGTIYTMDPDGTDSDQLYGDDDESTYYCDPSISPDGSRVVFGEDDSTRVCIVNSDGSSFDTLCDGVRPSWSADGQKIIYDTDNSIWTMDTDGTNQDELIPGDGIDTIYGNASMSPDGKSIVFENEVTGQICTAKADGTGTVSCLVEGSDPTWVIVE